VVLDASHIDKKSKGILELKDTHMPLMRLLALPALKDMYDKENGGAEIIFY
jgi:protein CMS1